MGRRSARRLHGLTAALSVAGHALVLLALFSARGDPPAPPEPRPITVELVAPLPPPEPPAPPTPQKPTPAKPSPAPPTPAKLSLAKSAPRRITARSTPAPANDDSLPRGEGVADDAVGELSDAQVAGAATAGSGGSGRPCDMTRRLQAALRKDPRVQAAVADAGLAPGAGGKAMWVWNGAWIRSHGQDGAGLAAVREAIMWEVAFAPGPCRAEPVHGLIVISLNDAPGAARLVVGQGDWRWSDLLGAHVR